jgi:uncharacterized protein (DUF1697 family)
MMSQYVALLRGINVGGKNLIKMADLAARFQAQGFKDVRTYIQSGNVIFSTDETDQPRLIDLLEEGLSQAFQYNASLVLRSELEMHAIVAQAPEGFGSEAASYRYEVIFLKAPLTAPEAMQSVTTKAGVDQAFAGNGVLYFSRLISRASQSHLTRIISTPIYQSMTIRNWNTTTKLLSLMQDSDRKLSPHLCR